MQEMCVWSLVWEDPLEKDMETYSSYLGNPTMVSSLVAEYGL